MHAVYPAGNLPLRVKSLLEMIRGFGESLDRKHAVTLQGA
jgi:hypothetical protein